MKTEDDMQHHIDETIKMHFSSSRSLLSIITRWAGRKPTEATKCYFIMLTNLSLPKGVASFANIIAQIVSASNAIIYCAILEKAHAALYVTSTSFSRRVT